MDRGCTGRFATTIELAVFVVLLMLLGTGAVAAAESVPEPPPPAQAAQQVADPEGLGARLGDEVSPVRTLDPAIFTGISPVTAADPAVRLPEDQREAEWGEQEDAGGQ